MPSLIAVLLFLVLKTSGDAAEPPLPPGILVTGAPARLVLLTANITLANDSSTAVRKFIFRVTAPVSELPYQRSRLVSRISACTVKPHRNGLDHYLEMELSIPGHKTVAQPVEFMILLLPVDFMKVPCLRVSREQVNAASEFLASQNSAHPIPQEVKQAAGGLFSPTSPEIEKARAAYEYPARVLKFRVMPKALGSAEALRTGEGDCTEYASVFCDLCRVAGIPARGVAVFNLAKAEELTSDEPNHNTAEVFLATHGWVPVDPNLGSGKYDRPVGFAKASTTEIVITREGAWVWGTWLPPEGAERDKPKPDIQVTVQWHAKVIQEGSAEELLLAFGKRRGS